MFNFLKKLSGKEIAMIITSVGGIILATILVYFNQLNNTASREEIIKLSTNHLEHNTSAILQQATTNEKVAGALDKLTDVIEKKLR